MRNERPANESECLNEYFMKYELRCRMTNVYSNIHKVRVATMTQDHDNTPYTTFNIISGTCCKVSEFTDFNLKNRNSDLPAYFSALIYDFSQFIKIPL